MMTRINETDDKSLIVIPFPVHLWFAVSSYTSSFNRMKNVTTKVYKSSLCLDSWSLDVFFLQTVKFFIVFPPFYAREK